MPIRPDHVAIYIRWSTDDQATGTTLEVQRDACSHYVHSQGWQVRDDLVFVDDGYSGGTLDRPAMRYLRARVARGEVDCVVVLKIDRLSRNIVDATQLVLREWEGRCHVKSVLEPIDTTTDLGRMIFGILAMFADFERATIRDRTQSGKLRRIQDGLEMHARPAFGYARDPDAKGRWIEEPQEASLVRRIFRMAADGIPAAQIVRTFNQEGLRTRRGKEWTLRAVLWILHNRTYIGEVEYGRTSLVTVPDDIPPGPEGTLSDRRPRRKRIRVQHPEPRVRVQTRAAPPLVDRETFEHAQDQLRSHKVRRAAIGSRAAASHHLLVGIAQCVCGGAIVYKGESRGRTHLPGYYICNRSRYGACSENGHIPAAVAETLVEQHFLSLFGLREMRRERYEPHIRLAVQDRETVLQALDNALREQKRLEEEDQKLLRRGRSGEIPINLLADLRASIQRDREDLEERIRSLRATLDQLDTRIRSLTQALEALDAAEQWAALETWQKRQLLRMVLSDRITIVRPRGQSEIRIDIPWAFQ